MAPAAEYRWSCSCVALLCISIATQLCGCQLPGGECLRLKFIAPETEQRVNERHTENHCLLLRLSSSLCFRFQIDELPPIAYCRYLNSALLILAAICEKTYCHISAGLSAFSAFRLSPLLLHPDSGSKRRDEKRDAWCKASASDKACFFSG